MKPYTILLLTCLCTASASGQSKASITIDASKSGAPISSTLHGVFFEEISHGGEGGLYAELIQNRGFEEGSLPHGTTLQNGFIVPDSSPHFNLRNNQVSDWKMEWPYKSQWPAWRLWQVDSNLSIALTREEPLNEATPHSMQVRVKQPSKSALVNEGFWGINVQKGATYELNFFVRVDPQYKGAITAALQSTKGLTLASYTFNKCTNREWQKFGCTLTATKNDPNAQFVLFFGGTGTVWLDMVSLFPTKTFKGRENGLRPDIAQYIADLHPAFVRWPGGCFVEGISVANTPNWKHSIGPIESRRATFSPWGYWSTNGFGFHEYLQFCEDLHADALYVANIGVSCEFRSGNYVPDAEIDSVLNDVLDAIEYAIGPDTSRWGMLRHLNGHPAPFPLKYIELGNEQHGPRYAARYNRFYQTIKEKYPQLQLIASMGIGDVNRHTLDSMKKVDLADEHAYKPAFWAMRNTDHFDRYKRADWKMYVGEYATNSGVGAGNMTAALSDAVYIMSMERNGDLVTMSSFAPLLVNEHDVDWPVNLIHFDAAKSFARISYYAIKMLAENRATVNLPAITTIAPPAVKKPLFKGGIGVATWDTQTEYSDIKVVSNGQVYFQPNVYSKTDWRFARGNWTFTDSSLVQPNNGAQLMAWLPMHSFENYTLTLKARKLTGTNAFIVPFAVKNDSTYLRAHIGSWVNSHCVFEGVTHGDDVAGLTNQFKLDAPIETGRWYTVRLVVGPDKVDCYLNDKLLMSYTPPPTFFTIAGKDSTTGEIIIKAVNAGAEPVNTTINLENATRVQSTATLITLSAPDGEAENSMAQPKQYIPVTTPVTGTSKSFELTFKPYSINVLRIRAIGSGQ
jgi:alpha-L-arabinofuranosidase